MTAHAVAIPEGIRITSRHDTREVTPGMPIVVKLKDGWYRTTLLTVSTWGFTTVDFHVFRSWENDAIWRFDE